MFGAKIMQGTSEKQNGQPKFYSIVYTEYNERLHRLIKAIESKFDISVSIRQYDSIKGQLRHSRRKIEETVCINKSNLQEDARLQIEDLLIYIYKF